MPEEWKESIIAPIYKKEDETYFNNYRGISFCHLPTKFYPTPLIIYSAFDKYLRKKNENTTKQCIKYLENSRKLLIQLRVKFSIIFKLSLVSQ